MYYIYYIINYIFLYITYQNIKSVIIQFTVCTVYNNTYGITTFSTH